MRILPGSGTVIALLTNGVPREAFDRAVFGEILSDLGAPAIPELPAPDPGVRLDVSRYTGVYERPGSRFEVSGDDGRPQLTLALDPVQAEFLGRPERLRHDLLPLSETHVLMPPAGPLEDAQTVAIYDFAGGRARYLHINARVHPRVA